MYLHNTHTAILGFLLWLVLCGFTWRKHKHQPPLSDQPAYLALARKAIIAGQLQLAVDLMHKARVCWNEHRRRCGFTRGEYQAVAGILYLENGKYRPAIRALEEALRETPSDTSAWFYLGQALFRVERYREAIVALLRAEDIGKRLPAYFTLLSRAYFKLEDAHNARDVLVRGIKQYPLDRDLALELAMLFASINLFGVAAQIERQMLFTQGTQPSVYLLLANTLSQTGHHRMAILLLEEVLLLFPDYAPLLERLAFAYLRINMPYNAARFFAKLAEIQEHQRQRWAYYAAEQFRISGRYHQALRWNTFVAPTHKRLVQLAHIYLTNQSYELAIEVLLPLVKRNALDPLNRYRLAHAAIQSGRYNLAKQMIKSLKHTELAHSSEQLDNVLKSIESQFVLQPQN
jgi:tetratricopeptide (TPR) repeat protein